VVVLEGTLGFFHGIMSALMVFGSGLSPHMVLTHYVMRALILEWFLLIVSRVLMIFTSTHGIVLVHGTPFMVLGVPYL